MFLNDFGKNTHHVKLSGKLYAVRYTTELKFLYREWAKFVFFVGSKSKIFSFYCRYVNSNFYFLYFCILIRFNLFNPFANSLLSYSLRFIFVHIYLFYLNSLLLILLFKGLLNFQVYFINFNIGLCFNKMFQSLITFKIILPALEIFVFEIPFFVFVVQRVLKIIVLLMRCFFIRFLHFIILRTIIFKFKTTPKMIVLLHVLTNSNVYFC